MKKAIYTIVIFTLLNINIGKGEKVDAIIVNLTNKEHIHFVIDPNVCINFIDSTTVIVKSKEKNITFNTQEIYSFYFDQNYQPSNIEPINKEEIYYSVLSDKNIQINNIKEKDKIFIFNILGHQIPFDLEKHNDYAIITIHKQSNNTLYILNIGSNSFKIVLP